MKVNYHTHTKRCQHAQGTEEEYVLAALANQMDILGFSDHGPYPDKPYKVRMPYSEFDEYLTTVDELKKRYASSIKILKSVEIEYLPEEEKFYEDLLTKKGLDYLLLGQHFYYTHSGEEHNMFNLASQDWCIGYAKAIAAGLKTGYYKILAHPDLFLMNENFAWNKNCDIAQDIILDAAISTNMILEYNANGLRRGIKTFPDGERYPYPVERFWKEVKKAGCRVIVGSDCHDTAHIYDEYVELAYKQLHDLGIEPLYTI